MAEPPPEPLVDPELAPARPKGTGPWKLRGVRKFLQSPAEELYEAGFFDAPPEEIRIRLRARDGKVEMVVYAVHQGRINELTLPFAPEEVFAELCG